MGLYQLLALAFTLSGVVAVFSDNGQWKIKIDEKAAVAQGQPAGGQQDWVFTDDVGTGATLRIKKEDTHLGQYCKGVGAGYTGYLSLTKPTRDIYFIFIESAGNPLTDPVVHWQTGGPGCSSVAFGLLGTNGPCRVNPQGTGTNQYPYSWTQFANMLYADEPAGSGFSHNSKNNVVYRSEDAAEDMAVLFRLLFKALPTLKTLPLHLAGQSNAGKHIPWLAKELLHPKDSKIPVIPVKSLMIGNGFFSPAYQTCFEYDMACTPANGQGPLLKPSDCSQMLLDKTRCLKDTASFFQAKVRTKALRQALYDTVSLQETIWADNYRDFYDVRRKCPDKNGSCDPIGGALERFLKLADVQRALGAQVGSFETCNSLITSWNANSDDYFATMDSIVTKLLDDGLSMLFYVGAYDFILGCVGTQAWLERLAWSGRSNYNAARQHPQAWLAGAFWQARKLVYALVGDAGHAVPRDNGPAALTLANQWLQHQTLIPVAPGTESVPLEKVKGCLSANKQLLS